MKSRLAILLLFIAISGCSFSNAQEFATSTPPPPVPSPSPTTTPPAVPAVISSPEPPLTATFSPYTGIPFSVVFTRNGNLWIANIGEKVAERQLTFEHQEMRIIDFDVSPDGTRIAYIPYRLEPLNSLIKLIDISTGDTSVILGENDPFSEIRIVWLDNTTIAYKNQNHEVPTFMTERVEIITRYIVYDLATKSQLGITGFLSMYPSPNRLFWLGCSAGVEGCARYAVQDLVNGKQYTLEGDIALGMFMGWSSDSQTMLFNTLINADSCMSQLISVDVTTLNQTPITAQEESVSYARFSSTENLLFYRQEEIIDFGICKSGKVDNRILNLDNQKTYEIPVSFQGQVWEFDWTPDSKYLLFFRDGVGREHNLWIMDVKGSSLRPVLSNVEKYIVLKTMP